MTERSLRAILYLVAAYQLVFGLLALLSPGFFFDEIGGYGTENSHYVGDVGAFYLAAGFGVSVAARRPDWRVPILTVGAVWYGVHAVNHAFDTGEASSTARGWLDTFAITLAGLASVYLAKVSAVVQGQSR